VSEFSRTLIARSGHESESFAALYDWYRFTPPPELLEILTLVAAVEPPRLVVATRARGGRRVVAEDDASRADPRQRALPLRP
jgi:hypothetical protein